MEVHCFYDLGFESSGWTNGAVTFMNGSVTMDLYTESGQCGLGTKVGTLLIQYDNEKSVKVTYGMLDGFTMKETNLFVGEERLYVKNGQETVNPADFLYQNQNLNDVSVDVHYLRGCSDENYVVAHATVCGEFPTDQVVTRSTFPPFLRGRHTRH